MTSVLYITHLLAKSSCGGAETQLLKTMAEINESSGEFVVDLFQQWNNEIHDYDILHLFNPRGFPIESLSIARFAKYVGMKVVVTPVFYHHSGIVKGIEGGPPATSHSILRKTSSSPLVRRTSFQSFSERSNSSRDLISLISRTILHLVGRIRNNNPRHSSNSAMS